MFELGKVRLILSAFLAWSAASAQAKTWNIVTEQSPVEFVAVGKPGFLKINGKGTYLQGKADIVDGKLQGNFSVDLVGIKPVLICAIHI